MRLVHISVSRLRRLAKLGCLGDFRFQSSDSFDVSSCMGCKLAKHLWPSRFSLVTLYVTTVLPPSEIMHSDI